MLNLNVTSYPIRICSTKTLHEAEKRPDVETMLRTEYLILKYPQENSTVSDVIFQYTAFHPGSRYEQVQTGFHLECIIIQIINETAQK